MKVRNGTNFTNFGAAAQKVMADLSKKQLQLIKEQESVKHQAKLALDLVRDGKGYRLILSNKSNADALAVDLRPVETASDESFLIESELAEKFPHKRLRAGEQIRLIAAIALGTPQVSTFHVTWQNADGSTAMEEFTVSL